MYDKKIEQYSKKAEIIKEKIRKNTEELKQIRSQIIILKYQSICESLQCDDKELADTFMKEHDLVKSIKSLGYTDEDLIDFGKGRMKLVRISEGTSNEE